MSEKDFKVKNSKEVELSESRKASFIEKNNKIVNLKMNLAALVVQISDAEVSKNKMIDALKEAASEYHSLIESTAKEVGLNVEEEKWVFNTTEYKFVLDTDE